MICCRLVSWSLLLPTLAMVSPLRGQEVAWRKDYAAARQEAANTGRPLMLHFTTTGCVWCQRLEQTTYRVPSVARALAERFIPLKIDAEEYPKLVAALSIQSYPTVVIASPAGRIHELHRGYLAAGPFTELLVRGLTRMEAENPAAAPPAPAAAPKPVEKDPDQPAQAPTVQRDPSHTPAVPVAQADRGPTTATPAVRRTPPAPPAAPAPPPPGEPTWMLEDFRTAAGFFSRSEFSRAVHLLRGILKDGGSVPVQVKAQDLLRQIEKQASERLARIKEVDAKGQIAEAITLAQELVRAYDGTEAAAQGLMQLGQLHGRMNPRDRDRMKAARGLLALAREDFRSGQWLPCLLRCEEMLARYSDLPHESTEAGEMAGQIKGSPERLQKICDSLPDVLGLVYLTTAEVKLKQGEPQQAIFFLERIMQAFPNSKHAEMAQVRLAQIQGPPAMGAEERKP